MRVPLVVLVQRYAGFFQELPFHWLVSTCLSKGPPLTTALGASVLFVTYVQFDTVLFRSHSSSDDTGSRY